MLIANLAVADFLVGIIGIPCFILAEVGLPQNFYGCLFMWCIILGFTQVSIFNLLTLAIDKFVAIHYTFFYNAHMTPRKIIMINVVTWFLGTCFGLVPMYGWNMGWNERNMCSFDIIDLKYIVYFRFFVCILVPLLLMLMIYVYIFYIAHKQLHQIASLQVFTDNNQRNTRCKYIKKELKTAKKFGLIIGIFVISWIPLETLSVLKLLGWNVGPVYHMVAIWLAHLNSAINPLLYAYGSKSLREAFKQVLYCNKSQ